MFDVIEGSALTIWDDEFEPLTEYYNLAGRVIHVYGSDLGKEAVYSEEGQGYCFEGYTNGGKFFTIVLTIDALTEMLYKINGND